MSAGPVQNDRGPAGLAGASAQPSLVEGLVAATEVARRETHARLDRFLQEPSLAKALALWLGWTARPSRSLDRRQIAQALERDVAELDRLLSGQVNAILHHPRFQQIEASWRGLYYLAGRAEGVEGVKIRALSVTWRELERDFERAIEFDQSQMFRKVYSEQIGMPGGEPFGVLLGDYEIWPRPCPEHPHDDMAVLRAMSQVAAAAFAPFIAGVHPVMFGLDDFRGLQQPMNLARAFDQADYFHWRNLRQEEDSRFLGLTLPRVLMRLPHDDDGSRVDRFRFREDVAAPDHRKYLWGNAAYAFGAVLIRSFGESGWLARIRGFQRDEEGGGLVTGLPVHSFSTDSRGVATKCSTDVIITDQQEQQISELGFIPLSHCPDTEVSVFYTNQSIQVPKKYDELAATMNARISAMLQYMLCVSRFAHYLKVAARDKIGAFTEAAECERYLYDWLQRYVTSDSDASREVKARLPLREARVQVSERPGKPGSYLCTAHLWPHFELEELVAAVKVTTEITPGAGT